MGNVLRLSNVIDNDRFKKNQSMTMTMKELEAIRLRKRSEEEVEAMASWLINELKSPGSMSQYCDFARYLKRGFLEESVKFVKRRSYIKNKGAYFGSICRPMLSRAKQFYAQGLLPQK